MAWYRAGTIAIAAGSQTVIGTNTNFIDTAAGVNPGDMLLVGGNAYEISGVTDATHLVLATAVATAVPAGTSYQIVTSTSMSNGSLAKKVAAAYDRILQSIANWVTIMTGSGTITIQPYGSDQQYSGLAWQDLTTLAQNALSVSSNTLTTVNTILANGIYLVNAGATGVPSGVTASCELENVRYLTTGIIQRLTTASATSGQLNRMFIRYGAVSGSTVTWTDWREVVSKTSALLDIGSAGLKVGANTELGGSLSVAGAATISGALNQSGGVNFYNGDLLVDSGEFAAKKVTDAGGGYYNSAFVKAVLQGRGSYGDARGAFAAILCQEQSNVKFSAYVALNGFGANTLFEFRNNGSAYAPSQWVSTSDGRIKTNIKRIEDPLSKMRVIKGATWERLDGLPPGIGFIAQDVQKAFPEAVTVYGDKTLEDGTIIKDVLAPDTSGVAAALHHEAILALMDIIDKQNAVIADLQKRMKAIDGLDS